MSGRNLIISGEAREETSAKVRDIIGWEEISSEIVGDIEGGLDLLGLGAFDLLTLNGLWSSLSDAGRSALVTHLGRGGGILALDPAPGCFGDWPEWRAIVGGAWTGEQPHEPEPGPLVISVRTGAHPITAGLGSFQVVDGVYESIAVEGGVGPLAFAGPEECPLLWAREVAGGRLVYDGLASLDERSFSHPAHRIILCRATRWLLGLPAEREWVDEGEDQENGDEEPPS